ncbi:hypothetical protein CI109_102302 [Kwoniella shandongensis]|uniref:Uncharacterized protein n=1 Tax=Kwoniella shandongensis TaxID=1734106 RepID=A0A5M6BR20_9TREE|nr:uncharacterized protein CI109_007132 [Kwoniella shandongensis]KAA5524532.1 hypothetical protein CI109_007132 [Kwoniella shandongensis]
MFNIHLTSLFGLLLFLSSTLALSEYQALAVLNDFAESFLAPNNIEIARGINSTLFAEDVTGTADVSTNFDGRELTTEYLFGLFVNTATDPTDPSPFGSPIAYNVTALAVENNFITTSIKFEFNYPILNQTFPIQIDAFILVNDKGQIQQYDASFRRWAWATDVIVPLLLPHMASRVNLSASSDSSTILRSYLTQKICHAAVSYCNGTNQQYDSYDDCVTFLNGKDIGQWYRMGEDNLTCRQLHVAMVPIRPGTHCSHIGPTGGDMCIPRDYHQVVLDSHFPAGWLAPKYVTPENVGEVGKIKAVSGQSLDPLLEIALSASDTHSWDPTLYATALLGYLLFFYVVANSLWFAYYRLSEVFRNLGVEHQKNVVMYTMNVVFTTIALALELVATPAFAGRYTLWEVQCLRTGGVVISGLYVFELIYRLRMRPPLIVHHFLTIIAISFTVSVFEYTQSMTYLISAVIWLFQATTEQFTFVGLLGYRLDWDRKNISRLLKFAAVQSFVFKSASAIGLIVYWGLHQDYSYQPIDKAWTAMVFIIAVGLLLTQIWGSYVTYLIGRRVERETSVILPQTLGDQDYPTFEPTHKRSDSEISVGHTVARRSGYDFANVHAHGYGEVIEEEDVLPSPHILPHVDNASRKEGSLEKASSVTLDVGTDENKPTMHAPRPPSVVSARRVPLPLSPTSTALSPTSDEAPMVTAPNSPVDDNVKR